jgi:hypothetical protein
MSVIFNGNPYELKYLFGCKYKNTIYTQDKADISRIDSAKSAFFDVKDEPLEEFWLSNGKDSYSVNLLDGHFEINSVPFKLHEEAGLKNFRVIYFRKHEHDLNSNNEVLEHRVEYILGWQANNENGENVQRILIIK